ncbi:MAG TPA: ABC transporter permease [Bacteroidia bacterium]|jgi:phospholipid/cholesterol/gamma-HCH transport system permease protein|nr:ABC transporter permease [Bacteroidia bacterium]
MEDQEKALPVITQKKPGFGERLKNNFIALADIVQFFFRFMKEAFTPPFQIGEIMNQSYDIGIKSLVPVSITAFVMGIVIVLQSRPALVEFGAGAYIPSMSAVTIIREVGPLITALICAGNIGSNISAELGSMKVTEQIDAMEVCGANPFKFLVVTRIIGATIIIPVLVVYADVISLFGSFTGANIRGSSSITLFFSQVVEKLTFDDVIPSLIKSVLFGFTVGIIACYQGFTSNKGTEGVGRATNRAVVTSLLLVIIIDMVIVQISNIFHMI